MEPFLKHYGVKGMKWGVRRDEATLNRIAGRKVKAVGGRNTDAKSVNAQAKKDWKAYKDSTTRKERREDRQKALEEKANYLIETALKNDKSLILISGPYGGGTLVSGREFVDHLSNRGAFAPLYTDVYRK